MTEPTAEVLVRSGLLCFGCLLAVGIAVLIVAAALGD